MLLRASLSLAFFGVLALSAIANAQSEAAVVGSVATLEGTVEIGRNGSWLAAAAGSDIRTGDQVRTGRPGRVRLVFHDDGVVTVGDGSLLKVEMSEPGSDGPMQFLLNLVVGKVRALVSEYYTEPLASYQIETATAVSAVRSTEFVVAYDESSQTTEVLGLEGAVAVNSVLDRKRRGVTVSRNMLTRVAKGKFPTPPMQIGEDDEAYRRLMAQVEFVGEGAPESLANQEVAPPPVEGTGSVSNPGADTPPPIDLGKDPVDRTPGGVIEQPTAPLSNGGAVVEF